MRRDLVGATGLALVVTHASACSVLFDPAQYATVDAATDDGLDASDERDAPVPDAFVDPDADANLDAFGPGMPDAPVEDAPDRPDAPVVPTCPGPTDSLVLPSCEDPSTLAYCPPMGTAARAFPVEVAEGIFERRGGGYRFGILGNNVPVVTAPAGTIRDHEIVREGDQLAVAWITSGSGGELHGRVYSVGDRGLGFTRVDDYDLTSLRTPTLRDLALLPGELDSIALGFEATGAFGAATCDASLVCHQMPTPESAIPGATIWVARTPVGAFATFSQANPTTMSSELRAGEIGGTRSGYTNRSSLSSHTGLRSTAGRIFYTELVGGMEVDRQVAFEPGDGTSAIETLTLGSGRPRVTAGDSAEHHLIGRLATRTTMPFGLDLSTRLIRCDAGSLCRCDGGDCIPDTPTEVTVLTTLELVDWTFENLGTVDGRYHRVAIFLLRDGSATDVAAAMWDIRDSTTTLEPVVIGTGRGAAGLGRSLRTVATLTSSRLEVFASVLVEIGGQDVVYLSGFRLERCGS